VRSSQATPTRRRGQLLHRCQTRRAPLIEANSVFRQPGPLLFHGVEAGRVAHGVARVGALPRSSVAMGSRGGALLQSAGDGLRRAVRVASSLENGYWKHPPVRSWIMHVLIQIFGPSVALPFVAAQVGIVIALAFTWRVARLKLKRAKVLPWFANREPSQSRPGSWPYNFAARIPQAAGREGPVMAATRRPTTRQIAVSRKARGPTRKRLP
jgi:hypothetical protein